MLYDRKAVKVIMFFEKIIFDLRYLPNPVIYKCSLEGIWDKKNFHDLKKTQKDLKPIPGINNFKEQPERKFRDSEIDTKLKGEI